MRLIPPLQMSIHSNSMMDLQSVSSISIAATTPVSSVAPSSEETHPIAAWVKPSERFYFSDGTVIFLVCYLYFPPRSNIKPLFTCLIGRNYSLQRTQIFLRTLLPKIFRRLSYSAVKPL